MGDFDINKILTCLSAHKPVFHSENDLQASFADEVRRIYPHALVTREVAYNSIQGYLGDNFERPEYASTTWTDILVSLDGATYLVELKYKTKYLRVVISGQSYETKEHSAHDYNRYYFLHDIQRLEDCIANEFNGHKITEAYAVFITNDPAYQKAKKSTSVVKDFDISAGKIKQGVMRNTNNNAQTVFLAGVYEIIWSMYSSVQADGNNVFWVSIAKTNETIIGKK